MNAMLDSTWKADATASAADGDALQSSVANLAERPRRRRSVGFRDGLAVGPNSSRAIFIACVIAQHFSRGVPTVEALCERFGMHRSTAYRWRRAWLDALGAQEPVAHGARDRRAR
jgi:hypothetical protein